MKKALLLVPLALLFLAVSCPPEKSITPRPDQLPPITQTGENTFGCLVNGKVWLPEGGANPNIVPTYYKEKFHIGVHKTAYSSSKEIITDEGFYLEINPLRDTGIFFSKKENPYFKAGFIDYVKNNNYDLNENDSLKNWIHISKIDRLNLIISGTFNIRFAPIGKDSIILKNGRFDVQYTY